MPISEPESKKISLAHSELLAELARNKPPEFGTSLYTKVDQLWVDDELKAGLRQFVEVFHTLFPADSYLLIDGILNTIKKYPQRQNPAYLSLLVGLFTDSAAFGFSSVLKAFSIDFSRLPSPVATNVYDSRNLLCLRMYMSDLILQEWLGDQPAVESDPARRALALDSVHLASSPKAVLLSYIAQVSHDMPYLAAVLGTAHHVTDGRAIRKANKPYQTDFYYRFGSSALLIPDLEVNRQLVEMGAQLGRPRYASIDESLECASKMTLEWVRQLRQQPGALAAACGDSDLGYLLLAEEIALGGAARK
jgi:hypothetical protein